LFLDELAEHEDINEQNKAISASKTENNSGKHAYLQITPKMKREMENDGFYD